MGVLGGTLNDVLDEPVTDNDLFNRFQHYSKHISGEAITGFQPVALVSGKVYRADSADATHRNRIVGVAVESVSAADEDINIATEGILQNAGWAFSAGDRLYIGLDGGIVTSPPVAGFVSILGHAVASDRIEITLRQSIKRS